MAEQQAFAARVALAESYLREEQASLAAEKVEGGRLGEMAGRLGAASRALRTELRALDIERMQQQQRLEELQEASRLEPPPAAAPLVAAPAAAVEEGLGREVAAVDAHIRELEVHVCTLTALQSDTADEAQERSDALAREVRSAASALTDKRARGRCEEMKVARQRLRTQLMDMDMELRRLAPGGAQHAEERARALDCARREENDALGRVNAARQSLAALKQERRELSMVLRSQSRR